MPRELLFCNERVFKLLRCNFNRFCLDFNNYVMDRERPATELRFFVVCPFHGVARILLRRSSNLATPYLELEVRTVVSKTNIYVKRNRRTHAWCALVNMFKFLGKYIGFMTHMHTCPATWWLSFDITSTSLTVFLVAQQKNM